MKNGVYECSDVDISEEKKRKKRNTEKKKGQKNCVVRNKQTNILQSTNGGGIEKNQNKIQTLLKKE